MKVDTLEVNGVDISDSVLSVDMGRALDYTAVAVVDRSCGVIRAFKDLALAADMTAGGFARLYRLLFLDTPAKRRRRVKRLIRETVAARRLEKMTNHRIGECTCTK